MEKIIALCLLTVGTISFISAQTYVNPLQGNIYIHDPAIIKENNRYYVFSTGALVQLKTSPDRRTWTNADPVLPSPSWFKTSVPANNGTDVWAPDISYRSGKYWLYYSVSSFGSNASAIGLATTTTLSTAKWTDQGMVMKSSGSNNYNCIDPNAFRDSDGSLWLVFGSFWTGIKLVQVDTLTGKPSAASTVFSLATRTSTALGVEAPFIIKHGVYYYLFVSWDFCCKGVSSTYNMRFGRASVVTGPYKDQAGVAMNSGGGTLLWAGDSRWKGPGGQSIFVDNDTTFAVMHSYDANDNGQSKLLIRPLYWTREGWPSIDSASGTTGVSKRLSNAPNSPTGYYRCVNTKFMLPGAQTGTVIVTLFDLKGHWLGKLTTSNAAVDLKKEFGVSGGNYIIGLGILPHD